MRMRDGRKDLNNTSIKRYTCPTIISEFIASAVFGVTCRLRAETKDTMALELSKEETLEKRKRLIGYVNEKTDWCCEIFKT